jgi:hypothetical protein
MYRTDSSLSAAEIRAALSAKNIAVTTNYVYTVVSNMKKAEHEFSDVLFSHNFIDAVEAYVSKCGGDLDQAAIKLAAYTELVREPV